jgi:hypothetical protein
MTVYLTVRDIEVAAIVRYVVEREVARHKKMKSPSESARHAAITTLASFGLDRKVGEVCVDVALAPDPIVKALGQF